MGRKLSLEDYERFYKSALLARQQVCQTLPKNISRLSDYQDFCRVCLCPDDGHLVDLDKCQAFEFEPTISTYRQLFQRASLQFQFHTMPDLPSCICGICAYKAKIFFLMTRQFVISQQTIRAAVTDFYRDTYDIEPPEQLEDLLQLRKQLDLLPKVKPALPKGQTTCKGPNKPAIAKRQVKQSRRSSSGDGRLSAGHLEMNVPANCPNDVSKRRKPIKGWQISKSTINLNQSNKSPRPTKNPNNNKRVLPALEVPPRREHTVANDSITCKATERLECYVMPRMGKKYARNEEPRNVHTPSTSSKDRDHFAQIDSRNLPLSKAQQQKKLLDRRRQWR